ncbi:YbdK family carboxylate-amine ligase [Leucobacter coleopterorum]|uniref:Putative glutamate--cysteine ligase 2 n=1 Tax=Leucobacter coleopterorum TaxID=2714933 RepID=A0ABX6JVH6_9MICO|nr:YbdK family carboxylate-amine ligase [Leucobacter coleopterorum]QIM18295.1 YbdK family carboxylate-amine ligase [Leucobacter coleopterorum]
MVSTQGGPRHFGVEEEYLLLDAQTGLPRDAAQQMIAALPDLRAEVEYFESQLETATPVCTFASDAEDTLFAFRSGAASAAADLGVVLASTGLPPVGGDQPGTVTAKPRYKAIERNLGNLVSRYYSTGTHVHVEVPSRDVGVEVMARMARWSPLLVALTANSPIHLGEATGFASWRYLTTMRWPTAGYPPYFESGADYDVMIEQFMRSGIVLDTGVVNWSIRLSENFPTVELRTADAQLDPRDTVAFAVIVRALVDRCVTEAESGSPRQDPDLNLVRGAHWLAARNGLSSRLVHPLSGDAVPAAEAISALIDYVQDQLAAAGDLDRVEGFVARRCAEGEPARLQLQTFSQGGIDALLRLYSSAEELG